MDTSYIGKPIAYSTGPYAGRTVRAELQEYQKPDLGRKFAKRDRRPLDPPPVIRLRMWEVFDVDTPTQSEVELHADDIDIQGLVAHVDLFPAAHSDNAPSSSHPQNASLTTSVFGSSFVHAVHMLDMTGQPVVFFVFADISVRLEGYFSLRYRFFDLFSKTGESEVVPVAAELFSGVFTVYSTKEFPGLQASTPLTKHLSRWGVRVNLREGERRRKPRDADDDDDDDDADDDDDDDEARGGNAGGQSGGSRAGGKGGSRGGGNPKGKGRGGGGRSRPNGGVTLSNPHQRNNNPLAPSIAAQPSDDIGPPTRLTRSQTVTSSTDSVTVTGVEDEIPSVVPKEYSQAPFEGIQEDELNLNLQALNQGARNHINWHQEPRVGWPKRSLEISDKREDRVAQEQPPTKRSRKSSPLSLTEETNESGTISLSSIPNDIEPSPPLSVDDPPSLSGCYPYFAHCPDPSSFTESHDNYGSVSLACGPPTRPSTQSYESSSPPALSRFANPPFVSAVQPRHHLRTPAHPSSGLSLDISLPQRPPLLQPRRTPR